MSHAKSTPLSENEHVPALLDILRENKLAAADFIGILGSVAAMEREMNSAAASLAALRRELTELREERNHTLRTALQNAAKGLSAKISAIRTRIAAVKSKIIDGCKNAADAFKTGGAAALNNLAGFFDVRRELESARAAVTEAIRAAETKIAQIEAAGEQYHAAGRAVRNLGRALQGKEPIPDLKPNGKLARLAETPFRAELRRLKRSLSRVNKSLAGLERLEKTAARQSEKERPSTRENMRRLQTVVEQRKKDAPAKTAEKRKDVAL
jgi:regulator of replication initiation timing